MKKSGKFTSTFESGDSLEKQDTLVAVDHVLAHSHWPFRQGMDSPGQHRPTLQGDCPPLPSLPCQSLQALRQQLSLTSASPKIKGKEGYRLWGIYFESLP